jgi:hypothetical protein
MSNAISKQINLHSLSNFQINLLAVQAECAGQSIIYHEQTEDDLLSMLSDTHDMRPSQVNITTKSGKQQVIDYSMGDMFSCSIGQYELNIQHKDDTVTVSSLKHPEVPTITLFSDRHLKAVTLWLIMHADKYQHRFTVETFDADKPHRTLSAAKDLKAGTVMDLRHDEIVDGRRDNAFFAKEYQTVAESERSQEDHMNVVCSNKKSYVFPPAHQITVIVNAA